MALLVTPVLGKGKLIGAAEPSGPPPADSRPERRLSGQREGWERSAGRVAQRCWRTALGRVGGHEEPGDAGPPAPALLVGVDVADGDGGEGQLLELHGDGHGRAVVVQEELGALPEDQPNGAQRQQDPDEPAQPPAGHHDAAAAVRVGVEAVPAHQLAQRGRLRAAHRQRLLDAGGDLPGGHGCGQSGAERGRERGAAAWERSGTVFPRQPPRSSGSALRSVSPRAAAIRRSRPPRR